MNLKKIWVVLLCILLTTLLVGDLFAQEQEQQQQRQRRSRWPWKGPEIGSVIKDFELPILIGGKFKLSDHKGIILIIELGACT